MRPKVSVVIPVYNRAHSVFPTLQSVQAQTMPDFECIVVDDGSNDGSELRALVERLNDTRFRYVRRENGGASAARNTGIDEARGDIVAFLDSDDRWLPEKLERDMAAGAGERFIFSPVMVERNGRIVGRRPKTGPRPGEPMAEYLACRDGFTQTSTIALPVALAKATRFDESITFGGDDTDFGIRLAAAASGIHMHPGSWVVMTDDETGERLSRSNDWVAALQWLDRIRPMMSKRAFLAYRGWHVARMAADAGRYQTAIRYYLTALTGHAFGPRLAAKALGQVLMRRSFYARFKR